MVNIQEILDKRFTTYEEAIAVYGSYRILIANASPAPISPLPCSLEKDMVLPIVQPLAVTTIELRLFQGRDGWWRFINMGEK
ncbi:hypothetical protein FD723_18560 [Nostoc sp. C052]|uniref:hypothetical protein n=1 Tax=Nostoc sp. C052 TaxID=2576902 RepID=UPI0015C39837|nr:hypothetical protein [Nostoc sp. C052]QLE42223.1 hypothetical protein FD723_18560 [Nostoc sp. C052]